MRLSKLGSLAVLALIASCGGAGDVPADTSDVGAGTRPEQAPAADTFAPPNASPAEDGAGTSSEASAETKLVGFAGSRFVVFDTTERALVFDTETEQAFGVYGHPVSEQTEIADPWAQSGLSPSDLASNVVASAEGSTMLVRTSAGVHAVDLAHRGALLAGWRGDAERVQIAPDGSMFAARTAAEIHLVRIRDGARASYPYRAADGGGAIEWTADGAYWSDADGIRAVERESFASLHVAMPSAYATASKDGKTFAVARQGNGIEPGLVEVWRVGDTKPRSKTVSAYVDQVTVDADGSHVAWAETSGEYDAPTFLHTLDVATGVHARFAAHGHCALDVERIVGFDDGALVTDAECSPGCPSLPSQPQLIAYDLDTGKKLREWSAVLVPPSDQELAAQTRAAAELSARLGVAPDEHGVLPLVHSPNDDAVVVVTASGLHVAGEDGVVLATLASSAGFSTEDVHFTPDGAWIVGIVEDGTAAIWRERSGVRVWSSK